MPEKMCQSRNWAFTEFERVDYELVYAEYKDIIRYICWGEEVCPKTKKTHYQGWIQFFNKKRMRGVKKVLKSTKVHVERCKGDEFSNDKYCKKDNKFKSFGKFVCQGQRTDLEAIHKKLYDGVPLKTVAKDHFETYCRYRNGIRDVAQWAEDELDKNELCKQYEDFELNEHQKVWEERLFNQNNRQILWIFDEKGGSGKTEYSKYLIAKHNAFRATNGKTKDISFAYNKENIIALDFSRSLIDHVNYDMIEQLKNGMIFSSKYESRSKIFKQPKIVVFSNFLPDINKLSFDRWDIYNVDCAEVVQG